MENKYMLLLLLFYRRFHMSVVIIGGHDRMVCQYKKICKQFNCKAKVFTQMSASVSVIGQTDRKSGSDRAVYQYGIP